MSLVVSSEPECHMTLMTTSNGRRVPRKRSARKTVSLGRPLCVRGPEPGLGMRNFSLVLAESRAGTHQAFSGGTFIRTVPQPARINALLNICVCACSVTQSLAFSRQLLEWVVIFSSRWSAWPRDETCISDVSCLGKWILYHWATCRCCSVTQLSLTLCDPMDCSTPGLPVHHQLLELTQTHVHWVGDAIQPSHPLSSPSPPAFNLSQHQGLFQWVSSLHQVAKILEFQLQHHSFQWIFRTDFL